MEGDRSKWASVMGAVAFVVALTGCESRLIDKTPRYTHYVPDGNTQRFEAEVVSGRGYSIDQVAVIIDGLGAGPVAVPMSEGRPRHWTAEKSLPRCQEVFTYRYLVVASNEDETRSDTFPEASLRYERLVQSQPDDCVESSDRRSIFTVNSFEDRVDARPGDGHCSSTVSPASEGSVCTLRAAIMEANANPGWDAIELPSGRQELTRTSEAEGEDALDDSVGDLDITDDVSIAGDVCFRPVTSYLDPETLEDTDMPRSALAAKIQGTGRDRVLDIADAEVHLDCLIVTGGRLSSFSNGAGIRNAGHLRMHRVAVTSGAFEEGLGSSKGTAIHNSNVLSMTESALVANKGLINGNVFGGTTGGALYNTAAAVAHVDSTLIAYNSAARGRSIWNEGELMVTSSTLAENASGRGAGTLAADIYNGRDGTAVVAFSTLKSDELLIRDEGNLSLSNNLLAGTLYEGACEGTIDAGWGNWAHEDSCFPVGPSISNRAMPSIPGLGFELENRGGFTPVLALDDYPETGPIDTAVPVGPCPLTDQRGIRRPLEPARCDAGAYEWGGDS